MKYEQTDLWRLINLFLWLLNYLEDITWRTYISWWVCHVLNYMCCYIKPYFCVFFSELPQMLRGRSTQGPWRSTTHVSHCQFHEERILTYRYINSLLPRTEHLESVREAWCHRTLQPVWKWPNNSDAWKCKTIFVWWYKCARVLGGGPRFPLKDLISLLNRFVTMEGTEAAVHVCRFSYTSR